MNAPAITIEYVSEQLLKHEKAEAKAKAKKDELAAQLYTLLGGPNAVRTTLANGHKVVVEHRENVSLAGDTPIEKKAALEALQTLYEKAPVLKPAIDQTAVAKLRKEMPEMYKLVAPYLTVKPGKPGIKVEKVER